MDVRAFILIRARILGARTKAVRSLHELRLRLQHYSKTPTPDGAYNQLRIYLLRAVIVYIETGINLVIELEHRIDDFIRRYQR